MIYKNIKSLCDDKKLSIRSIEKQAGLGNGTIAGWKECSPNIDNLQAVAKVLGVSINRLLKE